MKKILIAAALALPFFAFAQVHSQALKVVTQTATSSPMFGFDFGHDMITNQTTVHNQLDIIKASGNTAVRIFYSGWNNSLVRTDALAAKGKGFYTVSGGDWGTFNASDEPTYTADVIAEAKWAEANHIDQLSMGNEQEYRLGDITQTQWVAFLNQLYPQVKAVAPDVKISYETSGDFAAFWATQPVAFDLLGLNLYCGYTCNANDLQTEINAHGVSHVYVSETNADMSTGKYSNDATHAAEVQGDALKLKANFPNTRIFFFTFGANGSDGVPSYWGLYNGTTVQQPLTAKALGL